MYRQFAKLEGIIEKLGCINIMFDCINEHFAVDLSLNNDKISEQYDNYMNIIEIMQIILFEQYKELSQITNNIYDEYEVLKNTGENNG